MQPKVIKDASKNFENAPIDLNIQLTFAREILSRLDVRIPSQSKIVESTMNPNFAS
jgi:hypothetical protein